MSVRVPLRRFGFFWGGVLIRTWLSCSVQFIDIRSVTSFNCAFSGCDLKRVGRRYRRNSNDRLPRLSFGVIQTQSIFSPAARRKILWERINRDRRAGGLKMGWTKPLYDACGYGH